MKIRPGWWFLADRCSLVMWRKSRRRQLNPSAPSERGSSSHLFLFTSVWCSPSDGTGIKEGADASDGLFLGCLSFVMFLSLLVSPLPSVSITQGEHGSRVTPLDDLYRHFSTHHPPPLPPHFSPGKVNDWYVERPQPPLPPPHLLSY